jgi:hypothetical protein
MKYTKLKNQDLFFWGILNCPSLLKYCSQLACFFLSFFPYSSQAQSHHSSIGHRSNHNIIDPLFEDKYIPLISDSVSMIPYRVEEKYGFVRKGDINKFVISPIYEHIYATYKASAIVKFHSYYGLVDTNGKWIIVPGYTNLTREQQVFHGIRGVKIRDRWFHKKEYAIFNDYFTSNGRMLFRTYSHDQGKPSGEDTIVWFRFGETYSIYSLTGRKLRTFAENNVAHFIGICNNILIFQTKIEDNYHYAGFDVHNNQSFSLISPRAQIAKIYKLSNNTFLISDSEDHFYICDSSGQREEYEMISLNMMLQKAGDLYYKSPFFVVQSKNNNSMGVIDRFGKMIFDFNFNFIGDFHNCVAFCTDKKGNSCFIDTTKKVVLDASTLISQEAIYFHLLVLREPIGFRNGLCLSVYSTPTKVWQFSYFNLKGEKILDLGSEIKFASNFSEGLAAVVKDSGRLGFIDTTGKLVIPAKYKAYTPGGYPAPPVYMPEFHHGFAYIDAFKGYIDRFGREYYTGKVQIKQGGFSH